MDLVIIILGTGIGTQVNILEIKYMVLEYITLPMAIATKAHGMKDEGKAMDHTPFETTK